MDALDTCVVNLSVDSFCISCLKKNYNFNGPDVVVLSGYEDSRAAVAKYSSTPGKELTAKVTIITSATFISLSIMSSNMSASTSKSPQYS